MDFIVLFLKNQSESPRNRVSLLRQCLEREINLCKAIPAKKNSSLNTLPNNSDAINRYLICLFISAEMHFLSL